MSAAPDISIVLPVYNQADHIGGIVQDYQAALANLKSTAELVLVVNGNRDGSLDCCRELEKTHSEVRALHEEEPGWGRAVRKGLAAAQGNLLCYTNSARTSAYHLVLHMMLGLANPGLVIKANRRLRHPVARRIGSVLYNVECRTFFDLPVWDVNGTPKVFDRDVTGTAEPSGRRRSHRPGIRAPVQTTRFADTGSPHCLSGASRWGVHHQCVLRFPHVLGCGPHVVSQPVRERS